MALERTTLAPMARAASTMPCVATIIPANDADARTDPGRNGWIEEMNGMIKAMAAEEGALVADLHAEADRRRRADGELAALEGDVPGEAPVVAHQLGRGGEGEPVVAPRVFNLREGWRRAGGLLSLRECPTRWFHRSSRRPTRKTLP